ncbi:MAG TPA: DUF6259 domain-containing protein [Phycisphaerae bacterium]|nr:DUF6259 domain-containing protein [Phycisphaerae bacterium]
MYLAAEDARGHAKRWQRDSAAGLHVAMNLLHLYDESPGNDFEMSYDMVVRTFAGDWRDAAALYEKWAVRQPWCARRLADRPEVPAFLKEGAGILIKAGFNNTQDIERELGPNLERLPDLVEGKSINPKLGLCLEDTCEPAIPYMATYWSREFKGGFDDAKPPPSNYPNSVGLFSYLYHEYTTAIGTACVQGQGDQQGPRPPAEARCFILSNNLCRGLIPGPLIHDVPLEPTND